MNGTGHPAPPMVMSAGGKADGLSFDHVLHKLQAELQKSRETGQELQGLTSAMTDIQDTLGGGLVRTPCFGSDDSRLRRMGVQQPLSLPSSAQAVHRKRLMLLPRQSRLPPLPVCKRS